MPIDFGLLDPNAFYKGAANMNAMMQRVAVQKAGQHLNAGDPNAAVADLNATGDLEGAQNLRLNLDESDKRVQAMNAQKRQESTQLVIDAAHVLDQVRAKSGPQAIGPAFEQMVPLFKQRGATDQELDVFRKGIQNNPDQFLNTIHGIARTHMQQYTLAPGAQRRDDEGNILAQAPFEPQYKTVPAGNNLVKVDPNPASADQLPPEAQSALKPGKITTFTNGQKWTLGNDGNPQRVG